MATLYEIKECFREWQNKIVQQDGEITDEDMEEFANLQVIAEDKIEAYAVIIKEKNAELVMYSNEIKRLQEEKQKLARVIERMTNALDDFMREQRKDKFTSAKAKVTYRKSIIVDIAENAEIPNDFLSIKAEPDKASIKQFLQDGHIIYGCSLVERNNLQVK